MSLPTAASEVIKKIPVGLFIAVILFLVGLLIALTFTMLFTNKSVDFWPPKVGPDPALVAEFKDLTAKVQTLSQNEQAYRTQLLSAVQAAQDKSLQVQASIAVGMSDAASYLGKAETRLETENDKFIKGIEALRVEVKALQKKL